MTPSGTSAWGDGPATAVVVARDGELPLGADEAVATAAGSALVVGSGTAVAAKALQTARRARTVELGDYAPGAWSRTLAPVLAGVDLVVLPASPDGRDLAPRLAHELDRGLLAGAVQVTDDHVTLVRRGGLVAETHRRAGPVVVTLVPGSLGVEPLGDEPVIEVLDPAQGTGGGFDATVVELVAPDPATVDLADARRIVAGGAGLGGPEPFATLERVAVALGAAFGATRVASDVGWAPHDRYIGTTGVAVDPDLYVALAVSGAVQHVTGLGQPDHIVAVNVDPSAPMMAMADLALVTDARALLDELARRLEVDTDGR